MIATLQFYFSLIATSMRASISKRAAFIFEVISMIVNDGAFCILWWLFFYHYESVAGWQRADIMMLLVVGTGGYGLSQVFFGGGKYLSALIIDGGLDAFMIQPKNLLLYILGSRSRSRGWGHIATALFLLAMIQISNPEGLLLRTLLALLSMICSCALFVSAIVIAHSMPFWLGNVSALAKRYCDSLYLFALYPSNIYSGFLQLLMFTLIPAGVIGTMPVELIRDFTPVKLLSLLCAVLIFCTLAQVCFYRGLRRYESGNSIDLNS